MAQGRKRVDLGRTTFIYGESRYLLTSVDLPIVSQIIEASAEVPCLAMSLKLEMPVIRELLSREVIEVAEAPADSPAMATGEHSHGGLHGHRPVLGVAFDTDVPVGHQRHAAVAKAEFASQVGLWILRHVDDVDARHVDQFAQLLEAQLDIAARHERADGKAGRRLNDAMRNGFGDAPALEQADKVRTARTR